MVTFFLIYAIGVIIANPFLFYKVIKEDKYIDSDEYVRNMLLSLLSWIAIIYMIKVYLKGKNKNNGTRS